MLVVVGLAGSSFILVSLVVGIRLLLIAARTRQLPELAVGLALFLMGGFGWPLSVAAQQITALPDAARIGLALLSVLLMSVGMLALAVFTWRVFRPQAGWARALVASVAGGFGLCIVGQAFAPGYAAIALEAAAPWILYQLLPIVCLGWTGLESLRYARICVLRQRVGLADPVVTNRFLLWAICTLICTFLTVVSVLGGPQFQTTLAGVALISPVSLTAAVVLWFAFLPPAFYRRWLSRPAVGHRVAP